MENLILTDQSQALVALGVVAMMFLLFLRESFPTEVVAIFGVAVLLISGVLPYDVALAVLSNPAPWSIAAMFLVMGALVRTGQPCWIYQIGASPDPKEPSLGVGISVWICRSCIGSSEQCTRSGGDDPCVCSIGQNPEYIGQQAFDPPVLCGNFGRQCDPDWHLDQSFGRRGCAR